LYFSPWVIRPSLYCCSKFLGERAVSSTIFHFDAGTNHVVLAERNAGLERIVEAERQ